MSARLEMRLERRWILALAWVWLGCATPQLANDVAASEESVRPGINENFLSENLDVDRYVEIFEAESREIYLERAAIVEALDLEPGMAVADVGAGTGLFMDAFARAVGAGGVVYAVEIAPRFLDYLRERARLEGLPQVVVVEAGERSVALPDDSIDVAFVCDTYHHFEYPPSTLASLRRALRPGGSLFVVEFERVPGESQEWVIEHVRAGKEVFRREIERAGFELVREVKIDGLEENYVLEFRRP